MVCNRSYTPTQSGIWAVELIWNGERTNIHSTHISLGEANYEARHYFNHFNKYNAVAYLSLSDGMPSRNYSEIVDEPGEAFQAFFSCFMNQKHQLWLLFAR